MSYLGKSEQGMKIKKEIINKGFRQWQVASEVGINEATLSRWLRNPNEGQIRRIECAIAHLEDGRA